LSRNDKWVFDQITELATRIALNYTENELIFFLTHDDLDPEADAAVETIYGVIARSIQSRAISIGYDEVFGEIQRDGKILVRKDLIKQCVISALNEIAESHHM
jgi:hypothetical protein